MKKFTHTRDGRKVIKLFPTIGSLYNTQPVSAYVEGIDRVLTFTEDGRHYLDCEVESNYDLHIGYGRETDRLLLIEKCDGKEASIEFAIRGIKVYRSCVLRNRTDFRRKMIESYLCYKRYISSNG